MSIIRCFITVLKHLICLPARIESPLGLAESWFKCLWGQVYVMIKFSSPMKSSSSHQLVRQYAAPSTTTFPLVSAHKLLNVLFPFLSPANDFSYLIKTVVCWTLYLPSLALSSPGTDPVKSAGWRGLPRLSVNLPFSLVHFAITIMETFIRRIPVTPLKPTALTLRNLCTSSAHLRMAKGSFRVVTLVRSPLCACSCSWHTLLL